MSPRQKTHDVQIIKQSGKQKGKLRESEFTLEIKRTACGRDFKFMLKGSHLEVMPGIQVKSSDGGNVSDDWYIALTEQEKLDVMQAVAAHYREPSRDPDGMKTSAIGVIQNPDSYHSVKDAHLIYVGINNHHNSAENYKGCAEQGMVKSAWNSMVQHMHHKRSETIADAPFIKEVYVMGGRLPNPSVPGDKGVAAICPCGACTDLLAKTMVAGGHVYVMPHTNGFAALEINDVITKFSNVGQSQVWKTTIENLNRNHVITFEKDQQERQIQQDGLEAMAARLVDYTPPPPSEEARAKNDENYAAHRSSIAELDVATVDGNPDPVAVNNYLLKQLALTLQDRLKAANVPADASAIREWFDKKVEYVRCALIQLDNGCYYIGYDSRTGSDKAFVSPEFTALGSAVPVLGTQGVKKIWTMEFNPKAVARGELTTPSKDGLERAYKRHTKIDGAHISVCSLPLNAGDLARDKLEAIAGANSFDFSDVYVGLFAGNGITGGPGNGGGGNDNKFLKRYLRPTSGSHLML